MHLMGKAAYQHFSVKCSLAMGTKPSFQVVAMEKELFFFSGSITLGHVPCLGSEGGTKFEPVFSGLQFLDYVI